MKNILMVLFTVITCAVMGQAKFTIDTTLFDFGSMNEGDRVLHSFIVKNTGTTPLVIIDVTKPCGCTTPSFSQEPIMPGKEGKITISYDSEGHPGIFAKQLQIQCNDPVRYYQITITGNVIPKKKEEAVPQPDPPGRAND